MELNFYEFEPKINRSLNMTQLTQTNQSAANRTSRTTNSRLSLKNIRLSSQSQVHRNHESPKVAEVPVPAFDVSLCAEAAPVDPITVEVLRANEVPVPTTGTSAPKKPGKRRLYNPERSIYACGAISLDSLKENKIKKNVNLVPSATGRKRGLNVSDKVNVARKPSDIKSKKSKKSEAVVGVNPSQLLPALSSKGFCPVCQVPLICIKIAPSAHASTCNVPTDSPECPEGLGCRNTKFHHYTDFKHGYLANQRTGDNVETESKEKEIISNSQESNSPGIEENNLNNPFFDPTVFDEDYDDELSLVRAKISQYPPAAPEVESVISQHPPEEPEVESVISQHPPEEPDILSLDTEPEPEEVESDAAVLAKLPEAKPVYPCTPGICDRDKVAFTVTVKNGKESEVQFLGVGDANGWKETYNEGNASFDLCACSHTLNVQIQNPPTTPVSDTSSAKEKWAAFMKKRGRLPSSPASSCSTTSSTQLELTTRKCPFSKLIPGTSFAVDAFSYGAIPGKKYYFLSHFHSDHYMGLTSKWNHIIYCSAITARLAMSQLKIRPELLRTLEVGVSQLVEGAIITPLDANHCPGSLMLLFKLPDNTCHLHTGDFRATPVMESYPALRNVDIDSLFLDTTFCNPKYDFPPQDEVVKYTKDLIEDFIEFQIESRGEGKTLVVCGTYTIGKEKIFLAAAERLDSKIWCPPMKAKILRLLHNPRISSRLTDDPEKANVHVLPMAQITVKNLTDHLKKQKRVFKHLIALRPSGWNIVEKNKNMYSIQKNQQVSIYDLPYSEHSSFSELRRFVQFTNPRNIVPTVKSKDQPWSKVHDTCTKWLKENDKSAISATPPLANKVSAKK